MPGVPRCGSGDLHTEARGCREATNNSLSPPTFAVLCRAFRAADGSRLFDDATVDLRNARRVRLEIGRSACGVVDELAQASDM